MKSLFDKAKGIVPRSVLENILGAESRPWQMTRKELEARVTDSEENRYEIAEYLYRNITCSIERRP